MRPTVSSAFLGILLSILIVGIWLVIVSLNLIGDVVAKLTHVTLRVVIGRIISLLPSHMLPLFLKCFQVIAKFIQMS